MIQILKKCFVFEDKLFNSIDIVDLVTVQSSSAKTLYPGVEKFLVPRQLVNIQELWIFGNIVNE